MVGERCPTAHFLPLFCLLGHLIVFSCKPTLRTGVALCLLGKESRPLFDIAGTFPVFTKRTEEQSDTRRQLYVAARTRAVAVAVAGAGAVRPCERNR